MDNDEIAGKYHLRDGKRIFVRQLSVSQVMENKLIEMRGCKKRLLAEIVVLAMESPEEIPRLAAIKEQ